MKYRKDTTDIVDDNGIDMATLWHGNRNEAARNALGHKMAAAEELYEACQHAKQDIEFSGMQGSFGFSGLYNKVCSVLAKAEGNP